MDLLGSRLSRRSHWVGPIFSDDEDVQNRSNAGMVLVDVNTMAHQVENILNRACGLEVVTAPPGETKSRRLFGLFGGDADVGDRSKCLAGSSREDIDLGNVADTEPPNHPLLVKVTGWLTQIVLGDEAARMLADLDERSDGNTDELGLRVGQVWIWREPKIPVGRKGRAKGGASYALPIRVTWAAVTCSWRTPVAVPLGSPWSATGMGWDLSGVAGHRPARPCAAR